MAEITGQGDIPVSRADVVILLFSLAPFRGVLGRLHPLCGLLANANYAGMWDSCAVEGSIGRGEK